MKTLDWEMRKKTCCIVSLSENNRHGRKKSNKLAERWMTKFGNRTLCYCFVRINDLNNPCLNKNRKKLEICFKMWCKADKVLPLKSFNIEIG